MCGDAQTVIAEQHFEAEANTALDISASLGCVKSRSGSATTTVTYKPSTLRRVCKDVSYFGFGHDDFGSQEDDVALEAVSDIKTRLDCAHLKA